ncbi:MAG: cobalt ECF transporter T component CbiQ [Eubacteriales bacterium]|nr:cobalt ECF transporter T component CbiQ [Eubacteriales bacterium]
MNNKHPLVKLIITVFYIAVTVSFDKYDLPGLFAMFVYPLAGFILSEISFADTLKRIRLVLPFVLLLGILNPFLDRHVIMLGGFAVRGGSISMITLILKCIFTVLAAYLLVATTPLERICYALQMLHVPEIMITQIMLMYRYIFLLINEVGRISQAYALRAPGQKGINIKAWGPLVGQLLLRTIDRGTLVYESMLLRGYSGNYDYLRERDIIKLSDLGYLAFWTALILIMRLVPVITLIGQVWNF